MVTSCKFYMVGQWIKVYMFTIYTIYVECDDIMLNCRLQPNVTCNFIYTTNGIWVVHVSCNLFLVANYNHKLKLLVILRVLRLEFTIFGILFHLCCFQIWFLACIGLDYYTTKNTFNDIIINNLTKSYNTRACCFTKDYFFKQNFHLSFEELYLVCITLILMDPNIIKVWPYNTKTTKVIINAHKWHVCVYNLI
jgi:hypothetical protein